MSTSNADTTNLVAIDGRDALFFLIVRPGEDRNADGTGGRGVIFEHGGNGLSKQQAAYILRQVAVSLDPEPLPECPTCGPECANRTHDRIYRTSGY